MTLRGLAFINFKVPKQDGFDYRGLPSVISVSNLSDKSKENTPTGGMIQMVVFLTSSVASEVP